MKRAALIITARTKRNPDFQDIPGVDNDAREVFIFFKNAGYEIVRELREESKATIERVLEEILNALSPGDLLVIYFAGHGHLIGGHNILLCPEARLKTLPHFKEALPVDYLRTETDDRGLQRVLILDCCRNTLYQASTRGAAAEGLQGAQQLRDIGCAPVGTGGGSFHVLWGCSQGQVAPEIPRIGRGLFTTAMIDVFESWASRNGPVALNDEVFAAIGSRMVELTRTHELPYAPVPERSGNGAPPVLLHQPSSAPPAAEQSAAEDAGKRTQLVVSADGSTAFRSINQAIAAAEPGAVIRVLPGFYREAVVINKEVEILASGARRDVVIESSSDHCIRMATERAAVRGFTIRCTSTSKTPQHYGIEIGSGHLTVEECDVTSSSSSSIEIHGPGTDAIVRRCVIQNSAGDGIYTYDNATALAEDCDIFGHALQCVSSATGGDPFLRRCKIHDSPGHGVNVVKLGKGTLEDCDIFGHAKACVRAEGARGLALRRCQVHGGTASGMIFNSDSEATIEDCDIFGHADECITIWTGADPVIRRCKIHGSSKSGVDVAAGGKGTLEDCDIFGHVQACVFIREIPVLGIGDPTLRRCKLRGSRCGVLVLSEGKGSIEDCDIFGNEVNVVITTGGDPVLRRCKIHHSKSYGVSSVKKGRGTVQNCRLHNNESGNFKVNFLGAKLIRSGNREN